MQGAALDTAFDDLQAEKLLDAWRADLPGSRTPHVLVALPSYSVDRSLLEHFGDRVPPLEHRYVYALLQARSPFTRVVYLSSLPVAGEVVDGYLELLDPATPADDVRARSLLLSTGDTSPRPVAEKLLDRGDLIDQLRHYLGDQPGLIEPWNVSDSEAALAVALGVPIHGSPPRVRQLATKSNGRRLLRQAGVPVPEGVEDVCSAAGVAAAIGDLARRRPGLRAVVVKLDDSCAGDGNLVVPVADITGNGADPAQAVAAVLPEWFTQALARGGVVEELLEAAEIRSPSGQATITPEGEVVVLSTHEQRLGGADGQVYQGCSFPADPAYAAALAASVRRAGERLRDAGACGRYAVDFIAHPTADGWELSALEINLRKGGTTHPYGITRFLTGGRYDEASATYTDASGRPIHYGATDNLVDERWRHCSPTDVRRSLRAAGLAYDRATGEGIVPHLLDCLPVDGRMGYTAIGHSPEAVARLEAQMAEVHPG